MESPVLGNGYAGFGERPGETDGRRLPHRAPGRLNYPQPNGAPHICRRPKVGESSADHLYVKAAMSQSLLEQGMAGRFAFPPPIGSLLDVDLEDGVALRVHMDGSVPPDWAGGRTPVLGTGVVLEPGVLSNCPYVYRVRCESDGANRRVWIGTQSLAHPTEWVPLTDCSWTDDGLITPAATEILRHRPSTTSPAPAEEARRPGALPENVTRFIRGLEAAQRAGTVEHVRRLCDGSEAFLESLNPAARAEAEQALNEARSWLAGHEDYQQRVFADLEKAVSEKRAWDVRSQLQTATALTRRGASASEQRVLTAARAFLRQQDHLPAAGSARTVLHPLLAPRPKSRPKPKPTPKPQQAPKEQKKEPNTARRERRERRAAVRRTRDILQRLDQRFHLSTAEKRNLIQELAMVVETAGDWLSSDEKHEAQFWIRKITRVPKEARERPTRRELPPDVLESAAAAVRGALKKAAREQTTTNWARLKQQLGSALPHMTLADRVQVLTLVDQATPTDQALLSSLLAAGDPDMTTSYRQVAGALGLDVPADDDDLRDVLEADVQQVHSYWHRR
ncbi:hypothetical protein [Streptomyces sp. PSKA30]|uniref:hypothetical protein n=1 Tax=Streptomyces sp. PSKA30 TaxID=2874597 RepID=UPI001CD05499|nr:hypothetical protein [Streptomyces sp. PSKA30]MBZ9643177.1 hypothetical protein [Streptomyces sp. PSKA30]